MAKQQDPLRSIYNDLGLEQAGIGYDKFSTKFMADSNARRSVYNDLGLEQAGVDYDLFEERLGVKKKESSQSASQSGLEISGQPSAPSLQTDSVGAETPVTEEPQNLAQVDTSAFVSMTPEEMQAYGYDEDSRVTWSEVGQSMANSIKNVGTRLKGFDERLRVLAGQGLERIIGEDAARQFAAHSALYNPQMSFLLFGNMPTVKLSVASAYEELDRLSGEMLETQGLLENIRSGDPLGFLAGAVDAISALASTAIVSAPTAGAGLFVDMMGESIYEFNNQVAENRGVSAAQLYLDGEADYVVPAAIGLVGGSLEKIGFKGATNAVLGKMTGSMVRKAASMGLGANKEGMTEWLQTGLEAVNIAIANGDRSIDSLSKVLVDALFSDEGLEAYLMGAVGTMGAAGVSRAAQYAVGKTNRDKANTSSENISSLSEELSNENLSPAAREAIQQEIERSTRDLAEAVSESAEILDNASPEVKAKVGDLMSRLEQIQAIIHDPSISESVKDSFAAQAEQLASEIDSLISESESELSERRARQEEVDQAIIAFQEANPGIEVDYLEDLPESVVRTFDRIENGIPTDPVAVQETYDWIYKKYREIIALKSDPERRLTVDQLDGIREQLEVDLQTIQSQIDENYAEQVETGPLPVVEEAAEAVSGPSLDDMSLKTLSLQYSTLQRDLDGGRITEAEFNEMSSGIYDALLRKRAQLEADNAADAEIAAALEAEEAVRREEWGRRQVEIDEAIKIFQDNNPGVEIDLFGDLPETVVVTMDRVDRSIPIDPVAVDEASNWMYNKYQELTDLKKDPNRRLTIEQIEGIQEQLGEDITLLENYKLEQYGERAESTQVQPETAADTVTDQAVEGQAQEAEITRSEAVADQEATVTPIQEESTAEALADAPTATSVVAEESSSQPGQYFIRDIGGEQTVYRRNEDGTATIVPEAEAQTILSQQTEGGQDAVQIGETETLPVDEASRTGEEVVTEVREQTPTQEGRETQVDETIPQQEAIQEAGPAPVQPEAVQEAKDATTDRPIKPRTPKTLLKGIVDRLKKSGLARSVELMNSQQIADDLTGRTDVQFQTDPAELANIEAKAKSDGTWMKAPNGKPTNLNEKQWVQVRSKAFKDWFGDWINDPENASKVVDENGEPMVVYHGTPDGGFNEFLESKKGTRTKHSSKDVGFHFTNDIEYASTYSLEYLKKRYNALMDIFGYIPEASKAPENAMTYEVFLNIKKPLSIPDAKINSKTISDAKTNENDGIFGSLGKTNEYVALNPNQIKSATGNVGTFDPSNPDIRFQNSAENINGYVDSNGRVVINQDTAGIDTPIHEFAHLWEEKVAQDNPALHARGMELIKGEEGKPYVDHVKRTQPGLSGDALYKEALAQAIGDRGARLVESQKKSKIKDWLDAVWEYIGSLVGISDMTADQISNLTLNEFADAVAVDLLSGKPVSVAPNGDIVVDIQAEKKSDMNESEKRIADFMERMRNKNNIRFQGEIDRGSDALSQSDLVEFMTVAGDLARLDKIKNLSDLKAFANSIGITNAGDINAAWAAAQDFVGNPRSTSAFKKADMRKEFAGAPFEKMSDAEYIEIGKRMVDEGFIDPDAMAADIIENPRVLQTHETPAMTYGKRRLENRIAENRAALKKDPTNVDLRIEADALWSLMKDYDLATAITAYHWGKSGRLRDLTLDKEYTQVQALAEMEKYGEVSAETRARLEDLGRQLNEAKADLINKAKEIEALKEAQGQAGINSTARSKPVNRPRTNKATIQAAVEVLDSLDLTRFGVSSPRFQVNGGVRFSVAADNKLSRALGAAVATMRAQVESGKVRIEEAVETAINAVNSEVGENGWNPVAFRSEIINAYSEKGYVAKPSKPYVGRDGKPVVPGEYLTGLVSAHRSETGTDMTIDQMVEAAQAELGPSFSERDIRDSISGYGRASANRLSDDRKNINTAKTIGRLQSRLEDLQNLGYSPNSRQARARQVTEEIKDLRKAIQDLIDSLEDSPDYKSQMSQALENKKKYIEEYIKEVERRIKTYQDANARGERVPEGYFSKKPKYDFTSDPDIIALERKREEVRNKLKEEVYRHRLANRGTLERAVDVTEKVLFNTTRMLTAGADLSAVLVQGGFITMSDPAMSYRAFKNSVSKAGNKDLYEAYYLDLQNQPLFEAARKAKLNMQLPSFYESIQEEQFGRQNPITHAWDYIMDKAFGKDSKAAKKAKDGFPYAAAERQYAMYLTEIRFEMFSRAVNDAINHFGIDVNSEVGQQKLQTIASGVNDLTMASNIRGLDPGSLPARIGNILLFSMRKLAASWKLMLKMPYYAGAYTLNKGAKYAGAMGITNAARLKNQTDMSAFMFQKMYGKYGGTAMGTAAAITLIPTLIANGIYDPEDEEEEMPKMYNPNVLNPVHSDFMKLRWGNTRIDLTLGIGGNTVLVSRLIAGGYMTSSSPVFREFDQSVAGFRNSGAWDIFTQYAKNKLAPTPSIAFNKVFGTDFEKAQAGDRIAESLYPMWLAGAIEQYQDTGEIGSTIAMTGLGLLGLANNTYGGVEFADHRGTDNSEARKIFERLLISDTTPTRRAKQMYSPSDEGTAQLQDSGFLGEYQGDYNEYMTQATITRKPIITNRRLHPEKVNSLVNNMKARANKYAEVKNTGIYLDEDFRKVTNRKNETFKLTNAQISQKANILIRTMGSEKFQRFMPQLRKAAEKNMKADGLNPTKEMIEMEAFLSLYNSAHAEANRQMTLIINKGKMTLVPEDEYNSRADVKGEYDE